MTQPPPFENENTEQVLEASGETIEYIRQMIDQRIRYTKLEATESIAKTSSALITMAALAMIATLVLLFASITGGFYLSQLIGSYTLGFGIVTLVYLVAGIIVFFFRNQIILTPVSSIIIKEMFD